MTIYRWTAPIAALVLFAAMTVIYLFAREAYLSIIYHYGVNMFNFPYGRPFGDISGNLAAWECVRKGIDVIDVDPCDVLRRSANYSPMWLSFAWVPLGNNHLFVIGWTLDLVFIGSLLFLPAPRRRGELAIIVLATLSTAVVYAVERANPDIILFVFALAAGYLALGSMGARLAAYAITVFAATLLKYYPLAIMILSLRERVRTFLAVNGVIACVVLAFVAFYHTDLLRALHQIPVGTYDQGMFGAVNLPDGVVPVLQHYGLATTGAGAIRTVTLGATVALFGLACWWIVARRDAASALARLAGPEEVFLLIGSALTVGCFFTAQNTIYRAIYLLFVLPGLLALGREPRTAADRSLYLTTSLVILVLMWSDAIQVNLSAGLRRVHASASLMQIFHDGFWLLRELAWWSVVAVMAALLVAYVIKSAVWHEVLAPASGTMGRGR